MSTTSSPSTTTAIQLCLDALFEQQPNALDHLFDVCRQRLRLMINIMMNKYHRLRRWVEEEDVLQDVEIRLLKALRDIDIRSPQVFLAMAATVIRRQLIDLIRKFHHHFKLETPAFDQSQANGRANLPHCLANHPNRNEGPWDEVELHELVSKLPQDLRDVFELIYYHGMTHEETAKHLGISVSSSKHKFHNAKCKLGEYWKK